MRHFTLLVLFLLGGFTAAQLHAQTKADLTGTWTVVKADVAREGLSADLIQAAEQLQPALTAATLDLGADGQCKFVSRDTETPYTVENGTWKFDEQRQYLKLKWADRPGTLVFRVLPGGNGQKATLHLLESAVKLEIAKS
jgi:hypothetical protein